ncbi:MAG: hypothetical protein V7711_11285 [Pseudomonadales bacterium]
MYSTKPTFRVKVFWLLQILLCTATSQLYAQEWQDKLYLNGFYTLDLTYVDADLGLVSNTGQIRPYEKDKVSADNSLIGGQLAYDVSDNLKLTLQGTAFFDALGDFDTNLDWSYLSYDFGHDFSVRAGRFQIPFIQGTELRQVGISRLWARPLAPGNGAGGFNQYKGVELFKSLATKNSNWQFQVAAGKAEHGLGNIDNKNIKLASARFERDEFWVRASLLHAEYSVFTPRGQVITDSGKALMASIEAEVTLGSFLINFGATNSDADIIPDDSLLYLSIGYKLDHLTPFLVASRNRQKFTTFEVPLPPPVGPPPPGPPPAPPTPPDGVSTVTNYAAGLRWDLSEKLALKFQLENVRGEDRARPQALDQKGNAFTIVLEGAF